MVDLSTSPHLTESLRVNKLKAYVDHMIFEAEEFFFQMGR
ncbi:hypothetical protein Lser_V15G18240 [Lactuca serriola]